MPIVFSRGVIVVDENPNDITEIRTTSDAPMSYNTANQTYYKFDVTQSVGSRWIAQTNFFTLPTLTAGSVLFSNGTTISQDNTNFFWDNTNKRLGLGTASPTTTFDVVGLSKMTYSGATAGTRVLKVDHLGTGGGNAAYISATGTTANNNNALYLTASGSTTSNTGLQINVDLINSGDLAIECVSGAPSFFGGFIGVGTYTPGTSLDVAGEITVQNRSSTPTILAGFTSGGILGDLSLSTELSIASGQFKLAQQSATDGQVLTWVNASSKWLPTTISVPSSSTSATPNTLVLRTSDANTKSNNNVDNFTTTATAAGTTTLTVASSKIQEFTGSTTQTITLPVVSTLTTGHKFEIINNSTGNLTVNSSGSNLVGIIGPGSAAHLTCDLITGTSAASWTFSNITNPIFGIPFMFGDGVNVLTVGSKNGIYIPFGYTILEWTLGSVNGTSGSIQLDLWVDSQANFPPTVADTITASAKPLFTSTTKGQSSTLTGWTTTIAPDRWLYVNIDSVTSINQLSGTLKCRKL